MGEMYIVFQNLSYGCKNLFCEKQVKILIGKVTPALWPLMLFRIT